MSEADEGVALRTTSYMDSMGGRVVPNDTVLQMTDVANEVGRFESDAATEKVFASFETSATPSTLAAADKLPPQANDDDDGDEDEEEEVEPVKFSQLYRFASGTDKWQLFLGILGSVGMGVIQPCTIIFFGDAFDGLGTPSGMTSDAVNMSNPTEVAEFMVETVNSTLFQGFAKESWMEQHPEAVTDVAFEELYPSNMPFLMTLWDDMQGMAVYAVNLAVSNGMEPALANETGSMLYTMNMTNPDCVEMQWMMGNLDSITSFMDYTGQASESGGMYSPEALSAIYTICNYLLLLALAMVPFGFSSFYFLSWTAQKQGTIIRTKYLEALLRQEVGWYDSKMSGALTSQVGSQVNQIQGAMGDKLGNCVRFLVCFIASFTIAFYYAWRLTLVLLAAVPLLGAAGLFIMKIMGDATGKTEKKYAKAGGIADEALTLIKTVVAFGNVEREAKRYDECLAFAEEKGNKAAKGNGFGIGMLWCIIFWLYALGFWYGSRQMRAGELDPSAILIAFFSVFTGAMGIGQSAASITAFAAGKAAAARVYKIIDRVSKIDSLSEDGEKPTKVAGDIEFRKVSFAYPTRPDEPVFVDLDLHIRNNTNVGIVGESGCGKSTFVNMVERFYDPQSGSVHMDGADIRQLNVQWLRNQIAYVQQQPVLFPVSVFENIASAKSGATMDDVVAAAKMANAHDFITQFQDGYETNVGAAGSQLSGGQKQRIAIARALIGNPKILLLDEATSALDTLSEKVVYQSLKDSSAGRTTITIAHRLSTVKHCDEIIVLGMDHTIKERGSHDELMAIQNGYYAAMSYAQSLADSQGRTGTDADFGAEEAAEADGKMMALGVDDMELGNGKDEKKKMKEIGDEEADEENEFDQLLPDMTMSETRWVTKFMTTFEWNETVLGIFLSAVVGSLTPAYAAMFAYILNELIFKCNAVEVIDMYCGIYFALGFASILFYTSQIGILGAVGESVTRRLRARSFVELLNHKVQFFDMPGNGKAILTARLAGDAAKVKGLIIDRVPIILSLLVQVVGGIAIAMFYCYRLSLIVLSMFPIIGVASVLQMKAMAGSSNDDDYEKSGEFGNQAVENIRTVLAMGKVKEYLTMYEGHLAKASEKHRSIAVKGGLGNGFNEALITSSFAAVFAYGAHVMSKGHCTFLEFMVAQSCTLFPIMFSGQLVTMLPDVAKTKLAIKRIHAILGPDGNGYKPAVAPGTAKPAIKGQIELKNVHFTYPSRPDAPILQGLSLTIEAGQTVAFVGASGCGKSTIFALVEQFYTPDKGTVLIDGLPVQEFDTEYLRSQMGYVAQEPQLFSMSIGENVSYGLKTDPSLDQIQEACKRSNAHNFVMQAKNQYETLVGEKGLKLSGGQRQRIAIARGLIRKDAIKILLLDEATSALDTHSEELVQKELDDMCKGRTTLVIAHRLSTIQNADRIIVFDDGKIIEDGNHQSLLAKDGAYAKLCQTQNLGTGGK